MAEACTHNKYDDQPVLKPDYDAAYEYRRQGQRTMFPLAVAAIVELRGAAGDTERLKAIQDGIICAVGACSIGREAKITPVNDGSVDNYQPPPPRQAAETSLTA